MKIAGLTERWLLQISVAPGGRLQRFTNLKAVV